MMTKNVYVMSWVVGSNKNIYVCLYAAYMYYRQKYLYICCMFPISYKYGG